MIGAVVENLIGAFLSPRASVRRLIDGGHGIDAALMIVLLSYLAGEIFILITPGATADGGGLSLAQYMMGLIQSYVVFGLLTFAVHHIGRMFGGKGDLPGAAMAVAWWLLVVSIFTPIMLPSALEFLEAAKVAAEMASQLDTHSQAAALEAMPVVPGGALLILAVSSSIMLWLLASYIAELHGFARTWNVLFVVIGLSIPISMLAPLLMPFA